MEKELKKLKPSKQIDIIKKNSCKRAQRNNNYEKWAAV
jgi:hypothetical protein